MTGLRRNLLGTILAAAVIVGTAVSARADLNLTVSFFDSYSGFSTKNITVSGSQTTGSGTFLVGDASVGYTISSTFVNGVEKVNLNTTVSTNSHAAGSSIGISFSGGTFTNLPVTPSSQLTNTLSLTGIGGTIGTVTGNGSVTSGTNTSTTSTIARSTNGSTSILAAGGFLNGSYSLSGVAVDNGGLGANSVVTINSMVSLAFMAESSSGGPISPVSEGPALPEPSGMIAGVAGLPCMGLMIGFVYRIRNRATANIAL